MNIVRICGYAAVYEKVALYGDEYMVIARGAFAEMLRSNLPFIDVRWGGHGDDMEVIADTTSRNVGFFEDSVGLAFWADIGFGQNSSKLSELTKRVNPCDRASVNMEVIEESTEEHLGSRLRRIQRATIGHVAIGISAAAFMGTGVWPTHCSLDDAPDRIRDLAARWEAGWQAHEARRRAPQALRAPKANNTGSPLRGPRGEMSPGDASRLRSVLASRQADYAHVRRDWAAAAMKNLGGSVSPVFAHAAFTRAGGFDGHFDRLLASARAADTAELAQ
jgi:Caudovirus prohead serine protease